MSKDVSELKDVSVIYSFGRNFLACVTKAASVHTLEGCSVLWIMGVSFEEPSLPCTGTLGALACEKGGNKVVKFAQSTPPPPPAPFYSSPVFPTQHEVKDRSDARHLTHTSDDSSACTGHKQHIYKLKSIQFPWLLIATGPQICHIYFFKVSYK